MIRTLVTLAVVWGSAGAAHAGWFGWKASAGAGGKQAAASARPAVPLKRLTRKSIAQNFPHLYSIDQMRAFVAARQWKPSTQWLKTEGKHYGRLLVVSDMHPGPGQDPATGKTSPAEDFNLDRQEVDFQQFLQSEWHASANDGRIRTLVLNGDTLEFMQTVTAPEGKKFTGARDAYGPLNTARTTVTKLRAIHEGHRGLFAAYAQHLVRGHRIVLIPGNHDRQLLHPAVFAKFRGLLRRDVADRLIADAGFRPDLPVEGEARALEAARTAREMVKERLEFHPYAFIVGDVWVQHGNELDPSNSFTSPFGDWYQKGAALKRDTPMEAAMGDYFVKAVFNDLERKIPWGDNTGNYVKIAFQSLRTGGWGRITTALKLGRALAYVLTREGRGDVASVQDRTSNEMRRYVREYRLTDKLNELRQGQPPLKEEEVTDLLLEYQRLRAEPLLNLFDKDQGLVRRLLTLLPKLPSVIHQVMSKESSKAREDNANAFLMGVMGVKTRAIGHDHAFRVDRMAVGAPGQERLGQLVDTAAWTDELPDDSRRDRLTAPADRRGVVTVDFTEGGSLTQLNRWDPTRNSLVPAQVLESVDEAAGVE